MATYDSASEVKKLKTTFPGLTDTNFKITSPNTRDYNCMAWAVDEDSFRIDPFSGQWGSSGVSRVPTIAALMEVYAEYGYEPCEDGEIEKGYEKLAIYAEPMTARITHAAKQLPDGSWTSKLGDWQDIMHKTPEALQGADYGTVQQFMRRKKAK